MSKYTIISKPKLYYSKYKYRACLQFPNISLIRYVRSEKELDKAIEVRMTYDMFNQIRVPADRDSLLKLVHWKNSIDKSIATIRIDYDCISIYSNDLDSIKSLEYITNDPIYYSEINVEGDVGTLLRRNPKHKFRTHFRSKTVPDGFHVEIEKFLLQYKNSAFPTPSLKKWMEIRGPASWRLRYLDASFFIDYDDESFLSILALYFGEYLGKTYKVEQR